jgi:hypothetical protein
VNVELLCINLNSVWIALIFTKIVNIYFGQRSNTNSFFSKPGGAAAAVAEAITATMMTTSTRIFEMLKQVYEEEIMPRAMFLTDTNDFPKEGTKLTWTTNIKIG